MLGKFVKQHTCLYISIGHSGAVVLYFVGDVFAKKLFVRSVNDSDAFELKKILQNDQDAVIHLFLDTQEQSYVQHSLPELGMFGGHTVAWKFLNKEINAPFCIKSLVCLGKAHVEATESLYTFITVSLQSPVSTWLNFFSSYYNLIEGIYCVPVELAVLPQAVREVVQDKQPQNSKYKFWKNSTVSTKKTEITITLTKCGGIRSTVFFGGKVLSSRLLPSIEQNADIVAGDVEQEIVNCLDLIHKFMPNIQDEVNVCVVISSDIKKSIRLARFSDKNAKITMYTPYEFGRLLGFSTQIAQEGDRFADPVILALMHRKTKRVMLTHTDETLKVYRFVRAVKVAVYSLQTAICLILLCGILNVSNIVKSAHLLQTLKQEQNTLLLGLQKEKKSEEKVGQKLGGQTDIAEVEEIVESYQVLQEYKTQPITILERLSSIMPEVVRAKKIDISFNVPKLIYKPAVDHMSAQPKRDEKFAITCKFLISFACHGKYSDVLRTYQQYVEELNKEFEGYKVEISELLEEDFFENNNKPINLELVLTFPIA
ncbi:hypothetical protein EDM53_05285 [Rickettsiales endosymbiont of Peranema trichophorum]|uniref:hypothetical protein n=1 Tax=Rickettsiales endosymbiont of Peranema trichophorum TaxID=2486577 RepID=UPI001023E3F6|nr:hypothetical protein [Rickettsiales endosymbiont of Peranema trichophorum]RZI45425.1 hypothetical protein EDM53_05285 [Rickettsiales endosymbiont of Peranema trichophorum]